MEFSQGYRKDPLKTWMARSEISTGPGYKGRYLMLMCDWNESHGLHRDMIDGLELTRCVGLVR